MPTANEYIVGPILNSRLSRSERFTWMSALGQPRIYFLIKLFILWWHTLTGQKCAYYFNNICAQCMCTPLQHALAILVSPATLLTGRDPRGFIMAKWLRSIIKSALPTALSTCDCKKIFGRSFDSFCFRLSAFFLSQAVCFVFYDCHLIALVWQIRRQNSVTCRSHV